MTDEELLRELTSDHEGLSDREGLQRAVRDLIGVGLLQRDGRFVSPTRAAVVFGELAAV